MPMLRAPNGMLPPTTTNWDVLTSALPVATLTQAGTNPSLWQHLWESVHGVPGAQMLKKYLPLAPIENQGVKMTNAAMDEIRALLKAMQ